MLSRRKMMTSAIAVLAMGALPDGSHSKGTDRHISVYKTATCGCCQAWVDRLLQNGFAVTARDVSAGQLSRLKSRLGIPPQLASCHTARVGNYVVEGHVPANDIKRLLVEKPTARGLTVPGMPLGSPGMDFADEREAFSTLLIRHSGKTRVFETHN